MCVIIQEEIRHLGVVIEGEKDKETQNLREFKVLCFFMHKMIEKKETMQI